nr:hypothetical protein [Paenibacillus sedimenti]
MAEQKDGQLRVLLLNLDNQLIEIVQVILKSVNMTFLSGGLSESSKIRSHASNLPVHTLRSDMAIQSRMFCRAMDKNQHTSGMFRYPSAKI